MPQVTIRALRELASMGFTDADFALVHHMDGVGIERHIRYCEQTGQFRPGSNNVLVQKRLLHVLQAARSGSREGQAEPGLLRRLAAEARQKYPE